MKLFKKRPPFDVKDLTAWLVRVFTYCDKGTCRDALAWMLKTWPDKHVEVGMIFMYASIQIAETEAREISNGLRRWSEQVEVRRCASEASA